MSGCENEKDSSQNVVFRFAEKHLLRCGCGCGCENKNVARRCDENAHQGEREPTSVVVVVMVVWCDVLLLLDFVVASLQPQA